MLLTSTERPFDSPLYNFELKLDGVRMIAYCEESGVRLINRRMNDRTRTYSEAAEALSIFKGAVFDGEVLALNEDGRPDFYRLLKRELAKKPMKEIPVRYVAFDILELDGEDLTGRTYAERREILETFKEKLTVADSFPEIGIALYEAAVRENLEGIVAKRLDGVYSAGRRTDAWIKIKNPAYVRPT